MCTVSVVAHENTVRVICNRDERRSRPTALPPREHVLESGWALFPVDPEGGGTWIGANNHGVVAALLNRTDDHEPLAAVAPTSRGAIIPRALAASSIDEAVRVAERLAPDAFAPFRLVLVQGHALCTVVGGGGAAARVHAGLLRGPRLFASSSLGDSRVEPPRRQLFAQMLAAEARPLVAQAALHRHQWRDQRAISVLMIREDARTVSRTQVEVDFGSARVLMRYEAIPEGEELASAC